MKGRGGAGVKGRGGTNNNSNSGTFSLAVMPQVPDPSQLHQPKGPYHQSPYPPQ